MPSSTTTPSRCRSAASGPLAGLTFAVKDIYDVAGYPTGGGSPIQAAESPIHTENAPIVAAMLDAGARFVGKTQTDELTFSMNGQNKHFPEPVNVARRGPHHRRLVLRLGGGGGGGPLRLRPRLRHRRLGARAGELLRALGHPPDAWARDRSRAPCRSRPPSTRPAISPTMPSIFARVAPVFLGEDEQPVRAQPPRCAPTTPSHGSFREREAEALRPAEAKVEAVLGTGERGHRRAARAWSTGTGRSADCRRWRRGRRTAPGSRTATPT